MISLSLLGKEEEEENAESNSLGAPEDRVINTDFGMGGGQGSDGGDWSVICDKIRRCFK